MTERWYTLDEHGALVPATVEQWGRWLSDQNLTVAKDAVGDTLVLTIFSGFDSSIGGDNPTLWQTTVFGGPFDQKQRRYASKTDAMNGHTDLVELVRIFAGKVPK